MKLLSNRTDCIFHKYSGLVEEKEEYYRIETPSNPTFWFGNLLIWKSAPKKGEFEKWIRVHREEFDETLNHVTFSWDEEFRGDLTDFEKADFRVNEDVALTLQDEILFVGDNQKVKVRKVLAESEWEECLQSQLRVDQETREIEDANGEFRKRQIDCYKRLTADGRGNWWGGYIDGKLATTMGLFFDEEGEVGRFQNILTVPEFRRQRAAATLLAEVSRRAFMEQRAKQLVIHTGADEDNAALGLYALVGYQRHQTSFGMTTTKTHDELVKCLLS